MIHPELRLAAAKFALDLVRHTSEFVDIAHATLGDAVYTDGLAVIATTPHQPFWEASPHFAAALRELGHTFASQNDALRYLRLSYFGPIAEGLTAPEEGLCRYSIQVYQCHELGPLTKLAAWDRPSDLELANYRYAFEELRELQGTPWEPTNPAEELVKLEVNALRQCRDWCQEYARLYLQPAWRSPAVVSLAAAIHAERAFDRLPILADALEEAGCDHPDLLGHCRHNSPHTDYCWLVDAVLTPANGAT